MTNKDELLERLFWEFDTEAKTIGSTRDAFKKYAQRYVGELKQLEEQTAIDAHRGINLPAVGSRWRHKESGNIYHVDSIRNLHSKRLIAFPYTVVYTREVDGTEWTRPAILWHKSYEPYED